MNKKFLISLLIGMMVVMVLSGCEKNNSCEFCSDYIYYKPIGRFMKFVPEIFQYDSVSQTLSIDHEKYMSNREIEQAFVPPNKIPHDLSYSKSKTDYFIVCAKLKIVGQKGTPDAYGGYKKRDRIKCYNNIRPVNYICRDGYIFNNDTMYYIKNGELYNE